MHPITVDSGTGLKHQRQRLMLCFGKGQTNPEVGIEESSDILHDQPILKCGAFLGEDVRQGPTSSGQRAGSWVRNQSNNNRRAKDRIKRFWLLKCSEAQVWSTSQVRVVSFALESLIRMQNVAKMAMEVVLAV